MRDSIITLYAALFVSIILAASTLYLRFHHPEWTETQLFSHLFWGIYQ